jgi:predicted dehydrogenase
MMNDTSATRAKIRVGLIGVGNWANHGHLRVLDLLPDYKVVAVQARRREAAKAAAAHFSIRHVVDAVEELLALPDIDLMLVLNTAPHHS